MKGLTSRLLIFNLLLAVFPVGAFLVLGTYESQLLESQERAMVQQGRLLASALEGHDLEQEAEAILERLGARNDARLRVLDKEGNLIADSSQGYPLPDEENPEGKTPKVNPSSSPIQGKEVPKENLPPPTIYPEDSMIYKISALPARTLRRALAFFRPPEINANEPEYYTGETKLSGPEINAALNGRYGAATRISRGQRSVTLYSAIPIFQGESVLGAVLVSRSTITILSDIYQLRLDIAKIFFFSVGLAVVLSLLLARTVTVPVGRLRDQAEGLLDDSGKLKRRFAPLSGKDEVADLSRALYRLSTRLQERTDHMEDFMADLVHEMKNPVAGILSAAELAESDCGPEAQRFLTVINREGRRIERLLDDLRELISVDVRLDRGRRSSINLAELLTTIVESYPYKDSNMEALRFNNASTSAVMVDADPDRLAQAVLNLIDNALSFSPQNEAVEITLVATEKMAQITVADRGPGIRPEDAQRIFERWYTDRPTGNEARHTGLGLAIVQGIAVGYGGQAHALPRENGGACFILEFPRQKR